MSYSPIVAKMNNCKSYCKKFPLSSYSLHLKKSICFTKIGKKTNFRQRKSLTRNHFEFLNLKNKLFYLDRALHQLLFKFLNIRLVQQSLKHLRRIRLCELIRTVKPALTTLVYLWWGLNPRPFDREPTRQQLSLIIGHWN